MFQQIKFTETVICKNICSSFYPVSSDFNKIGLCETVSKLKQVALFWPMMQMWNMQSNGPIASQITSLTVCTRQVAAYLFQKA